MERHIETTESTKDYVHATAAALQPGVTDGNTIVEAFANATCGIEGYLIRRDGSFPKLPDNTISAVDPKLVDVPM